MSQELYCKEPIVKRLMDPFADDPAGFKQLCINSGACHSVSDRHHVFVTRDFKWLFKVISWGNTPSPNISMNRSDFRSSCYKRYMLQTRMDYAQAEFDAMMVAVDSDIEAGDLERALRRMEEFIQTFARPEDNLADL